MDTNLTNYLEFLENSSKFKAMDKAAKAQMLSQINELIKSEALWVRHARNDENIRDFIFKGYVIIFEINENIEILNIYKHNLPKL